jgi:L-ribulose-5-phosphate 3-epimerase
MKKSINLWAFPYPQAWSLEKCFQIAKDAGFDGVEVNYALDGDLSPAASDDALRRIGDMARRIGIQISGVCSFLFWPFALTSNDAARRARGIELAGKMIQAAKLLGTEKLLVVPGAVYIPWAKQTPPWPEAITPVPNDVCYARATEAVRRLLPAAEKAGVYLNMENIFANGFLFSPDEMNRFVDSFDSPHVQIHFDTGNIMQYQFPEHWIPILGKRIKNIHLKEFDKANAFNIDAFRPLLDGTTDWPAVISALDAINYRGYLTFEYFHPFRHYPEALIYQTSDSLDRMLGRKA